MNVLSAIYSGRTGFMKAVESQSKRAHEIALSTHDEKAHEKLAENLVGMKIDGLSARANMKTFSVSNEIMREMMNIGK